MIIIIIIITAKLYFIYSEEDQTYYSCTPCPEGKTTPTTAASSASDCGKQRQNTKHVIQKGVK